MRSPSRHSLVTTALLLTSPLLMAAPRQGTQAGSPTASQTGTQTGTQTASQTGTPTGTQTGAQTASATAGIVLRSPWVGTGCPVALSVRRTSPTELVNASDAVQHRGSQRIHLTVDPRDTSGIRSADITVHATSRKGRYLPAAISANNSPDLDRNFQISGPSTSSLRNKDLWIDGVGSVLFVDLTSITYIDGSTWQRSSDSVCRAIPSSFLLVSSR